MKSSICAVPKWSGSGLKIVPPYNETGILFCISEFGSEFVSAGRFCGVSAEMQFVSAVCFCGVSAEPFCGFESFFWPGRLFCFCGVSAVFLRSHFWGLNFL